MKKIFMISFTILCIGVSGHAQIKIADLDKLVANGKGEKKTDGVYLLPDKAVINGKEFSKTKYGALYASQNMEYFLLSDSGLDSKHKYVARLFDKKGNLILNLENPGDISKAIISDKGLVSLFYSEIVTYIVKIVDKGGKEIRTIRAGDIINGDVVENLYEHDAQFAKNSGILFVLAYFKEKELMLLGIEETGRIIYMEKVNISSMRSVGDWYARVYFNAKRNQVLIDSSGIGEAPPMLSYWALPQKRIFAKKTDKEEVIINASYAGNDDILLLIKKKNGRKVVRRLNPDGARKYEKSDAKEMDSHEEILNSENPIKVRSLKWGRE